MTQKAENLSFKKTETDIIDNNFFIKCFFEVSQIKTYFFEFFILLEISSWSQIS